MSSEPASKASNELHENSNQEGHQIINGNESVCSDSSDSCSEEEDWQDPQYCGNNNFPCTETYDPSWNSCVRNLFGFMHNLFFSNGNGMKSSSVLSSKLSSATYFLDSSSSTEGNERGKEHHRKNSSISL
jgi:hypothetical protein